MADRDDIIARIKALRARAADEASSEAETEAAARIAARIIAEHDVSEGELVERGTNGIAEGTHNGNRTSLHPALDAACHAIGQLTECGALTRGGANIWIGQPEDVEFALYLCELIQSASERAYKIHWRDRFRWAPSPRYRRSFHLGFGLGVADRMRLIVAERQQARRAASSSGTDLAVIKDALIETYLHETRPMLRKRRRRAREADPFAMMHGRSAAGTLALSRPLDADTDRAGVANHG